MLLQTRSDKPSRMRTLYKARPVVLGALSLMGAADKRNAHLCNRCADWAPRVAHLLGGHDFCDCAYRRYSAGAPFAQRD